MGGKKSNRRTPVSRTDAVERWCCGRGRGNFGHPRRRRSKGKNEGRPFGKGRRRIRKLRFRVTLKNGMSAMGRSQRGRGGRSRALGPHPAAHAPPSGK